VKVPFERIVAERGAVVLRVCRALLGGGADADDAWSETFLSALRAYPGLPADANVEAWLVRIASRKAIDQHRARARRPVPTPEIPERAMADGDGPDGDLRAAVAELPERQRLAITFHYLAGFPYVEVAEQIGGTPEAARRAAADGIARLRRQFVTTGARR
jgi:RNA polymerase sigma factor (sigma-70 family)